MGEMQRHRAVAPTSSARYFAGFTGYTALLGGLTENGRSAVNVLSFLCLTLIKACNYRNLGVRTNALIDTPFLMKTAETIRLGTGIPKSLTMKWWCQRSSTVAFRWKMRATIP